jgi:ABC-type multidrug transport system ATPase subunit
MDFLLQNAGKKFGNEWIFRKLDLKITQGEKLVIVGRNGSGKSTLLQVLAGYVSLTEGKMGWDSGMAGSDKESLNKTISFASPYLQLPEDLRLSEAAEHLSRFKPYLNQLSSQSILEIGGLSSYSQKLLSQFSSGMKQRLKLLFALLADTSAVFLDEPLSNLDAEGYAWYRSMIDRYAGQRTLIVCSNNVSDEYFFCERQLDMAGFKSGNP